MIDVARELAAEQEERHVGADDRDRLHEAVRDPQAGAGQQVVGQRVAGEALEDAEQEQQGADHPVELARLAERAGEEDAQHVDDHRGDEDHRGPVVHLPHQQAAADVEGDVQRRGVGLGHRYAAQLGVGALVDRLGHARDEPERQEDAGQQQDDEAPQRDLAEHEGPVVGEDLAEVLLASGRPGRAGRRPRSPRRRPCSASGDRGLAAVGVRDLARVEGHDQPRSQKLGPTGSSKSCRATR